MSALLKGNRFLFLIVVLSLLLPLFTAGCGSNYEPDELAYVLLLGIDHGAQNLLRVTYLIAIPKDIAGGGQDAGGGGGGGNGKGSLVTTIEAPSIYASMNMVNTYVGRKISLMHAKGLIFSETMAKDGFMAKFIPAITQFREVRNTMFLAISKEKPEEILEKMKPVIEPNPAKYIELLASTQNFTGFIPNVQLQEFYNELKVEGVDPASILVAASDEKLPPDKGEGQYHTEGSYVAGELLKKGGVPIEAMGAAAFREGRMVGKLNGDETTIQVMLRGKFQRGIFSFRDPIEKGNIIAMEVSQAKHPQIKIQLTGQGAVVDAKLNLEGNVLGNTSLIDYGLPENRAILEKAFAQFIKKQADALVKRAQQEFNSDILGFGIKARRLALTQKEWQGLNWDSLFENATVNIEVNYLIRRTGTLLRTMPVANPAQGVHEGENSQ
ncbi:Ger(x)C family spore germination protein [Zhaonella formicivorans]|uniref:Ger(x)C family spore germination protein n=1 Tax=Zhaonella formicivorans TaxID=2528593 RepID=UPI0010D15ACA|nr:Ger(x)C family spore germination protein [Zhaonella formicivorans]